MDYSYFPKPGEMFVALGSEYKDATVIQAFENKEVSNRLYGAYWDNEKAEFIRKPVDEFPKPFFPHFSMYRQHPKELDAEHSLYTDVRRKVEDFLLQATNYSASFPEIEEYLVKQGVKKGDTVSMLKVLAADTLVFIYKRLKSGEYLSFSKIKSQYEDSVTYYGSLAEDIKIKSNKISLLVSHSQTVGNYREFILRDLLKKYLPSKFAVATGFIEGFSRQLDIIIYDSHNFSPSFIEGELVVVQQEAVRGVIEVKTTLDASNLFDALEMFYDISLPGFLRTRLPIFKGVFAFDSQYQNSESIADVIDNFYNKPYYHDGLKSEITRDILYLYHQITCVCVMKQHCIVSKYDYLGPNDSGNLLPILFSVRDEKGNDIQTATFLSQLFDYLDVDYNAKKSSIWNFYRLSSASTKIKLEKKLAEDDWFPRTLIGHKGDQESIKQRHELFNKWFICELNTTDFIKSFD